MEFFGFGSSSSDFASPIGSLIRSATDPLLLGPDWARNIEICDAINSSRDVCEPAVKALLKRLQDLDQQVVSLSLIIAEACMKNCGQNFASFITKPFMDEMIQLSKGSKGSKNQEDALRLIQQWGKMFQNNRGPLSFYYDTYSSMKCRGVQFPPDEDPSPAAPTGTSDLPTDPSSASNPTNDVTKLQCDLQEVFEKVRLCREMMRESPGIQSDEALAEVIGYLEACRDRMMDLVEAGTQGLLGEELLATCLRANDAVLRTLEAEKNGTSIEVEDGLPPPNTSLATATATATGYEKGKGKGTGSSDSPAAMRTGVVDDFDNDEFSSLTLKTSARRTSASHSTGSKSRIPPPPQTGLVVSSLPPPPHTATGTADLLTMDDLLTGSASGSGSSAMMSSSTATSTATSSAQPLNDIDMFLSTAESLSQTTSSTPQTASSNTGAAPPIPPPSCGTTAGTASSATMSDADFDAFLSGISTSK